MKAILTIISIAIIAFLVIFVFQNTTHVNLRFLGSKMDLPVSVVSIGFYIIGAFSGTFLMRILKKGLKRGED